MQAAANVRALPPTMADAIAARAAVIAAEEVTAQWARLDLGARFTAARAAAGMSQDQLGAALGVSGDIISYWERGRGCPAPEKMKGICDKLEGIISSAKNLELTPVRALRYADWSTMNLPARRLLGRHFQQLRVRAGLSARELSELVGVCRSTVYFWEKGNAWPQERNLLRVAQALGVSTEDLERPVFDAVGPLTSREQPPHIHHERLTGVLLGARIRKLRDGAGLSQLALATLAGMSQGSLSRWELGKGGPKPVSVLRLAEALGVSPVDLLSPAEDQDAYATEAPQAPANAVLDAVSRDDIAAPPSSTHDHAAAHRRDGR